jgi:hypothetical protein
MPEMTWRTGQDVPEAGAFRCESCNEEFDFEANSQFPECPTEHKQVSWREASQVGAGAQQGTQWQGSQGGQGGQWQGNQGQTGRQTGQGMQTGGQSQGGQPQGEQSQEGWRGNTQQGEQRQWTGGNQESKDRAA